MYVDYNAIGQRIKKIRKQKRLTQEKVAESLEVSTVYISQVENGKTKLSLEMLVRLASLLDTEPGYFLTGIFYHSQDYLKADIAQLLRECPPEKLQLIMDVVKLITKYKVSPQ
ncbi:transcriptional regulator, y4mF family [Sporomusa termitida]|uniref:Transcriptional regulator, y4mF family n=1 Tax=Sporomusa termitida TaxID=2377 RepID=A0A517DZ21_9FIRM|nr:transcriptional regulator, y4mF family [Sporomusa termitida]